MRNGVSLRALALVPLLASLSAASAHAEHTPSVVGTLHTGDGLPVPQLVLRLLGPAGSRSLVTGPAGRFEAAFVAQGAYEVQVTAPGFQLRGTTRFVLADRPVELDLVLEPAPIREQVLVSATRSEAVRSTLGVTATVLDRERIAERESSDLLHLLQEVPGVAVARAGGLGGQASVFLRGGESRFARVLVDGIPANEPGGVFNLGSLLPLELERIEVVRGAESSLYGTDALAGVIHLVTRRADPDQTPGLRAELEGGNLAWTRFLGATSGRRGKLDWNLGVQRLDTDNEQPNSAFEQASLATNVGVAVAERTDLRMTLRLDDGRVGTPGQTAFGRPDLDADYERSLLAMGLGLRHATTRLSHEVRAGLARTDQLSVNPVDSGCYTPTWQGHEAPYPICDFTNPEGYQNDTERQSLAYRGELQVGGRHLLSLGADLERERGELGDRREDLLTPERTNFGFYLQDRAVLFDRLFLTLGGRVEHNDSFGTEAVPRAALSWHLGTGPNLTVVRASAGAGIKEPTFYESFGVSSYARGNPNLKPERSRSFDLGVEQHLLDSRLRLEASLFHQEYRDQVVYTVLDYTTFEGSYINLGKSRARGLELSAEAAPSSLISLRAEYTYLDGEILESASLDPVQAEGAALLRRPEHQASLSVRVGNRRVSGGAHLLYVGRRLDSDFLGLGLTENDAYYRLDARLRARLHRLVEVFAAGENLLDEEYQEVLGYPALGRSLRIGLRLDTNGRP
jgi:vitamin B12 transporter